MAGFPHSEISGSKVAWDLPETYRTLQRPSSSNNVKASTVRSYAHYENTKLCFLPYYMTQYDKFFCLQYYFALFLSIFNCNDLSDQPHRYFGLFRHICEVDFLVQKNRRKRLVYQRYALGS